MAAIKGDKDSCSYKHASLRSDRIGEPLWRDNPSRQLPRQIPPGSPMSPCDHPWLSAILPGFSSQPNGYLS